MVLADCQRSGFRSLRKGQRPFGDPTLNSGVEELYRSLPAGGPEIFTLRSW